MKPTVNYCVLRTRKGYLLNIYSLHRYKDVLHVLLCLCTSTIKSLRYITHVYTSKHIYKYSIKLKHIMIVKDILMDIQIPV